MLTEDNIKKVAYSMWEAEGKPEGKDLEHYYRAEKMLKEQEANGSWFGRWGTNYLYGTWSVLAALEKVGHQPDAQEGAEPGPEDFG